MGAIPVEASSDRDLIRRARLGSREALDELVRCYYPPLQGYLSRMLGPEEAQDALQDVFIKMAQGLDRYRDEDRFGGWLFRIAVNRARDLLRRRPGRPALLPEPIGEPLLADGDDNDRLATAIAELPSDLAEALVLMYQEGLTQAEIAGALGLSVAAVKMRVYRAIRQLRALMKVNHE